jgi:phosphoenolpyruvate-protein phosphotransferase (PTS system enzyme I)
MKMLKGLPASRGVASGRIHLVDDAPTGAPALAAGDITALLAAAESAASALEGQAAKARGASPSAADVLEAQALMLRDPALVTAMEERLDAGEHAQSAVLHAFEDFAGRLEALGEEYFRERAADVREAARHLLATLSGANPSRLADLKEPRVVVARELSPADTLAVGPGLLLGIVTETGGVTSHAAIVARELGIPAVLGVEDAVSALRNTVAVEVDGDRGEVRPLAKVVADKAPPAARRLRLEGLPAQLMANAGSAAAVTAAARRGALGVGLFRTEFLFLGRSAPVSEAEQAAVYAAACAAMAPHPVVVRTLDAGSDKALEYLPRLAPEPNPALGRRGLRLWLSHPQLAEVQIRALVRVGEAWPNLRVMIPMVAAPEEMATIRGLFAAQGAALPPLGIMVETPAAAASLAAFDGLVDFVSLGTNDLVQYAVAADRELSWGPELGELNPGALRLIELAVKGARELGIEVGVCGEMASRPEGAVFLAGIGASSLSMGVNSLPEVAHALRAAGAAGCRRAAQEALAANRSDAALQALRAVISGRNRTRRARGAG